MISTDGLTKRYGSLIALHDFSLEVARGEIVALVGPNGAGKTTALKLIVGLSRPDEGRVRIADLDVHRQGVEAKRLLAFLPDQPFLYEQLTVGETLGFIAGLYELPPARVADEARVLLGQFGLADALHRRVSQLSYGMKSRLVLIASLLHDPQVLVMDEPFFGLDPQTLRGMRQLLTERARTGLTVLLSTHQLSAAEHFAHRILILHEGRTLAVGTLHELQQRYGDVRLEDVFFHATGAPQPPSAS